jgi:acyl-CoA thioesterase-1
MVPEHASWPYLVGKWSEGRYEIINMGVSGDTTADGLLRLGAVRACMPHMVVVEFGINDMFYGIGVEQAEGNLDIMVKKFLDDGAVVVLAGFMLDNSLNWQRMYERLAMRYDIVLYRDILAGLRSLDGSIDPELVMADGLHPNEKGYEAIARDIFPVIELAAPSGIS